MRCRFARCYSSETSMYPRRRSDAVYVRKISSFAKLHGILGQYFLYVDPGLPRPTRFHDSKPRILLCVRGNRIELWGYLDGTYQRTDQNPGYIWMVERYHAPIRASLEELKEALNTKVTDKQWLEIVVQCINVNIVPEGLWPSVTLYGEIPRPAR